MKIAPFAVLPLTEGEVPGPEQLTGVARIVRWGVKPPDPSMVTEGWGWKPGAEPSRFVPAELTGAARLMAMNEAEMQTLVDTQDQLVRQVIAQMEDLALAPSAPQSPAPSAPSSSDA